MTLRTVTYDIATHKYVPICKHEFYLFGDQVKSRRCLHCNALESIASAAPDYKENET
jgi:hypothetical protein